MIRTLSKKSVELWGVKLTFLRWSAVWLELPRDTDHLHKAAAILNFTRFQPLGSPHLASATRSRSQAGERARRDPWRAALCMPRVVLGQATRCYLDGVSGVIALFSSWDERQQSWWPWWLSREGQRITLLMSSASLQQMLMELGDISDKTFLKANRALVQKLFTSVESPLLFIYNSANLSCPIQVSARENKQKMTTSGLFWFSESPAYLTKSGFESWF